MNKNFENSIDKLENIVRKLESGELSLNDSINEYKEGLELSKYCNEQLEKANELVVNIVSKESEINEFNK